MSGKPYSIIVTPPPNKEDEDFIKKMDSLSLNEKPKGGSSRNSRSTKGASRRSTKCARRRSTKCARKSAAKKSRKSRK